jgi:competence protein ComFB
MVSLKGICEKNGDFGRCSIVNANYEKVMSVLDRYLRDARYVVCRCEKCISDIAALALNYLPPHYYVDASRGGGIGSPTVMVESAVIEAMEMVGKNPRHYKL